MPLHSSHLPQGVYVFSAQYRDQSGEVTFTFRGARCRAFIGVNAFGHLSELAAHADSVPTEPFCGRNFDVPVVLIPAGVHECPAGRAFLTVKLTRGLALLGEMNGISPNAPGDIRRPNPARSGEESVLAGSFYFGTLDVIEGDGSLILDGLTLRDATVQDARRAGDRLGLEVSNCIIAGASERDIVTALPLAPGQTRTVRVTDCRVDGLDAMDAKGRLLNGMATRWVIERLYYAHTKKFFGLTDYGGKTANACSGGSFEMTLRDCVLEDCDCPHGVGIVLPADTASARIMAEDCVFSHFASTGDPVFRLSILTPVCTLTLRRCMLSGDGDTAVLISGSESADITQENSQVIGYATLSTHATPRRTQAPAQIGVVEWGTDRLDDPHRPCRDTQEALRWLDLLYGGRAARFGDMHVHTDSGGTSDGTTPLGEFVQQIKALGLDFAAVVDHKQIRHALLPEWDDELLLCGTEPALTLIDESRPARSARLHYTLIFRQPTDYFRLMAAFPEYQFTGGPDGHYVYAKFTPERFRDVIEFVYHLGGTVAHAHPKQMMASDDPMHYYFGDHMPLETILTDAGDYNTVQNVRLWEALLKLGKRVHTRGDSDTHREAKNCALTSTYTPHRLAAEVLDAVRDGDCAAGCIGVQMAINCVRMGSHLPYRDGLKLAIRLADYYRPGMKGNTVYCLKAFTDRGLAYASEFNGTQPQALVLPVKKRMYYRVEVTNESDGAYVAVSNPIWLD